MSRLVTGLFGRFKPSRSTQERRDFVRSRIALYCNLMFWSFLALVGFINVMYEVYPDTRPDRATTINVFAAIGVAMLAVVWAAARRQRDYSENVLTGIDVAATSIIGLAFAASAILAQDRLVNVYSSFMWVSFAVFGRSLIVPSSGSRTAFLGSLGVAPMLVTALAVTTAVPRPALFVGTLIFCVVIVVLSTVGSHVIYGLRQQVREAMQLGQYTIGQKIGEGGMGTVYKARHALLRRPTAIKLLKSEGAQPDELARFEKEVQLTSELTHPNTIAVYDYGRSPDGVFYYAMEYLDGIDLELLVAEHGAIPEERVVHILRQVCGALAEAHDRGLIHRDIKPSNVILCCRGGIADVAKVLDFGLVKEMAADEDDEDHSKISGTPAYLSPESIASPDAVTPLSDIYALGAVAYFLLTGELVFPGKNLVQLCYKHLHEAPVSPSARGDAEISPDIEKLVMACLEKDPADRPASAKALGEELSRLDCATRWTQERAAEWWAKSELPTAEKRVFEMANAMTIEVARRGAARD